MRTSKRRPSRRPVHSRASALHPTRAAQPPALMHPTRLLLLPRPQPSVHSPPAWLPQPPRPARQRRLRSQPQQQQQPQLLEQQQQRRRRQRQRVQHVRRGMPRLHGPSCQRGLG